MDSFYGEEGCCLTCDEGYPGCWCEVCACRECPAYNTGYAQKCGVAEELKKEKK